MDEGISNLSKEFINAVNALFHGKNKEIQMKANQFIYEFDKRPESWEVSYQILSTDNLSDEVYFNAIQILKNKIKYDFGNYSENREIIIKLISFLIEKIDKFKNLKHYILINYCQCFSMTMLFSGSDFTILMKKCVEKLNNNDNIIDTMSLLLIFNYLADVYFDKTIVIDEHKRNEFNLNLNIIANDVIRFLNNLTKNIKQGKIKDEGVLKVLNSDLLETFSNWLILRLNDEIIQKLNNEYIDIVNFVFEINETNIQKHTDCICNLLEISLDEPETQNLGKIFFSKIMNFKEIFYKNINLLDSEQSSFYVEIFIKFIQNNLMEILNEGRFDLIQLVVDLTKICPSNQIDLICDFFNIFDQFLYEKQVTPENIMIQFKQTFIQLIKNMINLMTFPYDIFKLLNENKTKKLKQYDDYINIKDYRYSIKIFLTNFTRSYTFNFVYINVIFPEFKKTVERIKENPNNLNHWSKFESILCALSSIVELVKEKELNSLNVIFNTILDVPKEYIQITRTVTYIIDQIDHILGTNENLLKRLFKYLIDGLSNELTLKYCSISANNLLSKNKEILSQNKNDLIQLYNESIKNNVLDNDKYLAIFNGLIEVICYGNENEQDIEKNLINIFQQWVIFLIEAKNKAMNPNSELSAKEIEKLIELLVILKNISRASFEGLSGKNLNIMQKIFNEIWIHLKTLLIKFSTNNDLVEEIIQLIKYYMRGLKENFIPFIEEYLYCLIEGYKISPISSYLYGFEVLITVYGNFNDEKIKNMINLMFNELCKITFANYIRNSNDLLTNIQLGEDFFGLMYRILKVSPIFLIDSEMLNKILTISLESLSIDQIQISKNIIILINNLIDCTFSNIFNDMKKDNQEKYNFYFNKIQNTIQEFISPLIKEILNVFLLAPPNIIYENIKDLVMNLVSRQQNFCVIYFTEHLTNFPNDVLTNKEKENFINLIQNFKLEEKRFEDYLEILYRRCQNKQRRGIGNKKNN